jgi:hypothetical protein
MQNKLITVLTFSYQHEIAIVRGRLETEGIDCYTQDELTAQVNPLYSNAIGGIKLQVKENDLEKAVELLIEWGYIKEDVSKPNKLFTNLNKFTSKIPLLKNFRFEFRLMLIIAVIVGICISIVYLQSLPTTKERLTKSIWCLDYVNYNGKNFMPDTRDVVTLSISGSCTENIIFSENGIVTMPGFKCRTVFGNWQLENDMLKITNADTFDFVYNGIYKMDFNDVGLILKSKSTTLNCHPDNSTFNF